ncbi:hypothetical protein RRG08_024237 [Elysia crispata]|uniref:Uncharacterized protein n=1 Tax=Elysia crispata TaxID=231223 RepID=A0AAE0YQH5_9GAST|nr:hypothetical protein RRG08_024237 [Elysia crispata]
MDLSNPLHGSHQSILRITSIHPKESFANLFSLHREFNREWLNSLTAGRGKLKILVGGMWLGGEEKMTEKN